MMMVTTEGGTMDITALADLNILTDRANKLSMIGDLCITFTAKEIKIPGDCDPKSYDKGYWQAVSDVIARLRILAK